MLEEDGRKTYWGWKDIADLPEAIIFYAEGIAHGHHHHEISKMLDEYFPRIDRITLNIIRLKAFTWLKSLVTNIDIKIYLAKSLIRLERICANEHEKTRNVLTADAQITHLLNLTGEQAKDGPEELAAKMRAFLVGIRAASDGTAATAEAEAARKTGEAPEAQKTQDAVVSDDELKKERKAKEEVEEANLQLRCLRAKRLKECINKLKGEGIKDVGNHDDWESETKD